MNIVFDSNCLGSVLRIRVFLEMSNFWHFEVQGIIKCTFLHSIWSQDYL